MMRGECNNIRPIFFTDIKEAGLWTFGQNLLIQLPYS